MKPQFYNTYYIFILLILLFIGQSFGENKLNESTATLPLSEILKLYQEKEDSKKTIIPKPPLNAAINRLELTGQLLENAVDLKAHFEITILDSCEWTQIRLFKNDKSICISELPEYEDAIFVKKDGYLTFLTKKKGVYYFDISFIKKAIINKSKRKVIMHFCEAAKADLNLRFDEDLFKIYGNDIITKSDGVLLYPVDNIFSIYWTQNTNKLKAKITKVKRPPIESMINTAYASSVSTLEGKLITRFLYDLSFEGTKIIKFDIPNLYKLEKVYLNGSAIPFECKDQKVKFTVLPSRAGDQSGNVELVLTKSHGNYLLSGNLEFIVPKVSWPIREMFMDIYLPAVFNL